MITKKKVLILTTTDNMIWQFLIPHIRHLQKAGNTVECACARTGFWFDDLKDKHGLYVHEIGFTRNPFSFKNIKGYKKLKKLVKATKYDLIHCHQPVGGVMGRKVGAACKVPVLYVAHGFHFYKGAPLTSKLYKLIETHYAKKTGALVTINDEDFQAAKKMKAKNVYKINGIGYDSSKVKDDKFDKDPLRKEIGITEKDFVVLNVAECNKNKNQEAIINAISMIDENVKLIMCGTGNLLEYYKHLAHTLGCEDKVEILGYRTDVPNILKLADAFIMASLREGLPVSVMEAMSNGLPIIASNIRGNRDLVEDRANGLLVDLNEPDGFLNALKELSQNKQLCKEMGQQSREKIQKFSIQEVLKQMEEIYISL